MIFQEFGHLLSVLAVAGHPQMQRLQTHVGEKCVHGGLAGSHIAHQLRRSLLDKCQLSEFLGIDNSMIGFVRGGQSRIFVRMGFPVEIAAVHNAAAHGHGMAVHVFGGGMGDDIHAKFEGLAVNGGGKGVVADHGHAVAVGQRHKLVDIQHHTGGVGYGFRKYSSGIGPEIRLQFFGRKILVHQGSLDSKPLQGHCQQIGSSAVYFGGADHMAARLTDIGNRQKGGRLSGRCQHGRHAALQITDLLGHHITGGILQTGIEITLRFQVK